MWLIASDVVNGDPSQPIVVVLISTLGGVFTAVIAALVSLARREGRDSTPPGIPSQGERVAVLERRAEDNDERDDVQDHRLDSIERHLDREHPEWRP